MSRAVAPGASMQPISSYLCRPIHSLLSRRGESARLQILIYHRVLEHADPLQSGDVTVDEFRWQMELVARHFRPLPLAEAAEHLANGTLPARSLCVSFDDGYADNVTHALPVLRDVGVPATVFVATNYLNGGIMFNDAARCCIDGFAANELDLSDIGLPTLPLNSTAERQESLQLLQNTLKYLSLEERRIKLGEIAQRTETVFPTDLMMTHGQLLEAARGGFDIGAHTVNHPILALLGDEEARQEIRGSREYLQRETGQEVPLFAYPNGAPGQDYTERDRNLVEELGFRAAVSTRTGYSTIATDAFQLRRFTPWDKSPSRFLARLFKNYIAS